MFKAFSNPANHNYVWVVVDIDEVIFLSDFRWGSELFKCNECLLLLEGHTVHPPAPKNHFTSDICIDKDKPVFAISKDVIKFISKYNITDEIENDMMAIRRHVFDFTQPIACDKQKDVSSCSTLQ